MCDLTFSSRSAASPWRDPLEKLLGVKANAFQAVFKGSFQYGTALPERKRAGAGDNKREASPRIGVAATTNISIIGKVMTVIARSNSSAQHSPTPGFSARIGCALHPFRAEDHIESALAAWEKMSSFVNIRDTARIP